MGMMIIRHKVRDYGQWRPVFDEHEGMQKAAGLSNPRVYHSADSNKSEIVAVFDTKDTKMAKSFAASADLKEAMSKAGVVDTPTIYSLEFDLIGIISHYASAVRADRSPLSMSSFRLSSNSRR